MSTPVPFRQRLIERASELYMRIGIRSVSMDDIARELGVSKKTIYQEVDNKQELVSLVMAEDARRDLVCIQQNLDGSRDAIDELLRNARYFIQQMRTINPTTLHDLQKYYKDVWDTQIREHQAQFRRTIAANIERGMEEGLYRSDLDGGVLSYFFVGSMMTIIDTTIFPATTRPITDIIRQHSAYHLHGIVNEFGRERLDDYLRTESLD